MGKECSPKNKTLAGRNFTIRPLGEQDSFEDITELLHRAYRSLSDMGLRFLATYQDSTITKERCLEGYTFLALDEKGKIVSTITISPIKKDPASEYYFRKGLWEFGQFAVEPDLQKTGLGSYMIEIVEQFAKENSALEIALNTSEKALHLIDYYRKRGYDFREYVQWETANYRSVIMSKML